ncbi:hypothetical protein [Streptomyces sp. NPDC059597]|uniref:hypothetical protein n=1 Tax=Streptomyces sp. NPDC059597 TaxID=3346879 RepID=UPI00368A3063
MDTREVAAMPNMSTSWICREVSKLGLKGYKLDRGRNAKTLYRRARFKWLEQQKTHEERAASFLHGDADRLTDILTGTRRCPQEHNPEPDGVPAA